MIVAVLLVRAPGEDGTLTWDGSLFFQSYRCYKALSETEYYSIPRALFIELGIIDLTLRTCIVLDRSLQDVIE